MSDRLTRKGQYMTVSMQDDDERWIDDSESSKKPKSCFCELISKISRRFGQLKQWLYEEGVRSSRINKDDTYPIMFKNYLVNAICLSIGHIFCNRTFTAIGLFLFVCFIEPLGRCLLRLYKRHHMEPKERWSDSEPEVTKLKTKLNETEEDLKDVREDLENERREKDISNSRLYDSQSEVKRLETRLQEERREKENALKRVEEEKCEKEKALTRLSAVAGDKLRLNNPGIADLSDENRPNKLAEKFSELYDNEWTEVFEVLEEENFEEEKIIEMLLEILKEIYNSCLEYARDQRENLVEAIAKPSKSNLQLEVSPEGIMSKVIDLQKQTASFAFLDVKNTILQMKTLSQFTDHKVKQKYLDRCVQLCWMMSIQDPPMMLDFGPRQDEEVDKNTFRMYTKQGDRVDFIVWPAVFLHKNGPLVQKGVLQPK